MPKTALIVGAGNGLSASLARLFAKEGLKIALAARHIEKLTQLSSEIGAVSFAADASKPEEVNQLFIILRQPRSAWTWEVELRPWVERF